MSYRVLSLLTERASGKLGQRRANLAAAYSGLQAAVTDAVAVRNACSAGCTFYALHWSAGEGPTPSTTVDGRSRDQGRAGLEVLIGGL